MDTPTISTLTPATIAGLTIPGLGEIWSGQGGRNAGLMRGENGNPDYYVIAIDPAATASIGKVEFGNYGKHVAGADCDNDGLANTLALLNSGVAHRAAEACRALIHEGHSDIYLAARGEAALCYFNAREGYPNEGLWTSSQSRGNDVYAWVQPFNENGAQWHFIKYNARRVCAVRRLSVI